ncbi:MAG: hypothetical protein EGR16_05315 [Clostridiales bacterium]|nr:hypothetical protein [Clostridiales bacterium]
MNERIAELSKLTLEGKMLPTYTSVKFDRMDLFLPEHQKQSKRIYDYIMAQKPVITEYQTMTGHMKLDVKEISGPFMNARSLKNTDEALRYFYNKPIDNLSTFEWLHATADFGKIIRMGIKGLIEDIEKSKQKYKDDAEKISFLDSLKMVADALIKWAHKCSAEVFEFAQGLNNAEYKKNLLRLSEALKKVPQYPAGSFYEAVLSIYILFSYEPDGLGTLDRILYDYYKNDVKKGILTKEEAKEILQELFLMLQANTRKGSANFTRGGESHFCVGGYDENGEDVFNDFSMLILEAMCELPTYIPQISLRWTKKLPFETFLKVLDMSVNDKNNRIAFVSDEVKIYAATHIAHFPYEVACRYSSVGCNELTYPGGFFAGTTNTNMLRSIENTLYNRKDELLAADTWGKFFDIYKSELFKDVDLMIRYDNEFMRIRAKDTSYVTSLLFTDCIESAKTFTKGSCKNVVSGADLIGITNVIDSLCIIKQFVYDEKIITMSEMIDALKNNWSGYEELRELIKRRGKFFGNDDETSNYIAKLFCETLYEYTKDKTTELGYHLLFGNLQGYNPHHQIFGSGTRATPDGRRDGEMLKFGIGQSGGYDREGLTALLNAVSKCDKHCILSGGPSVTNLYLDEKLVLNKDNFIKTAKLLETYFKNGGSHFQLNYVSQDDLRKAKIAPENYKNLRVRVSGFSDFFVNLTDSVQDEIIRRTVKSN